MFADDHGINIIDVNRAGQFVKKVRFFNANSITYHPGYTRTLFEIQGSKLLVLKVVSPWRKLEEHASCSKLRGLPDTRHRKCSQV